MIPTAAEGFSTLRLTLPDHLVREHATRKGLTPPSYVDDHAHMTVLYGLPGDVQLQEEHRLRIADLLRYHRVFSVDVTAPVVFVRPPYHALAFMLFAKNLSELRSDLLEAFPHAHDPYRHSGWVPHVTLSHLSPGTAWQLLEPTKAHRWYPVSLPVVSFELHRADGAVEVLTPLGDLTAYR